jgi:hypothetical protein
MTGQGFRSQQPRSVRLFEEVPAVVLSPAIGWKVIRERVYHARGRDCDGDAAAST